MIGYQEMFCIHDYTTSSAMAMKYKATRNGLPVLPQIHPLPTETELHRQVLCQGAFLESELMSVSLGDQTMMEILAMTYVEKIADNIVYRSRDCQLLLSINVDLGRCDKCFQVEKKLNEDSEPFEERPSLDRQEHESQLSEDNEGNEGHKRQ